MEPLTRLMHITVQQGDDHPIVIPVVDEAGAVRDVTGWSALAVVRRSPSEPPLHRWSTAEGSAECGPGGVLLMTDDSDTWTWTRGMFDVRVTSPDGTREVPARGAMFVNGLCAR